MSSIKTRRNSTNAARANSISSESDSADEDPALKPGGSIIPGFHEKHRISREEPENVAGDDDEEDVEDDDEVVIKDTSTIKTRSSNGITKKRQLKDAAILSDDEEYNFSDVRASPKKSKVSATGNTPRKATDKRMTPSRGGNEVGSDGGPPALVEISDSDIEVSVSPLKLTATPSPSPRKRDKAAVQKLKDSMFMFDADQTIIASSNPVTSSKPSKAKKSVKNTAVESVDEVDAIPIENKKVASPSMERKRGGTSKSSTAPGRRIFPESTDVSTTEPNKWVATSTWLTPTSSPETTRRSFKDVFPAKRSFKDVIPNSPTTPMMSNGPTLHEDGMKFTVSSLPDACEVTHSNFQDPFIKDDYKGLPNLKQGVLVSWSSSSASASAPMGLVSFSEWSNQCPEMDYDTAYKALSFVRYKNFINPSRVSPLEVNILYTSFDKKKSTLQCNFKTAICLSPILVKDSSITCASPSGLRNKYISGYFHKQEWQCFEGFACMAFDRNYMVAQIQNEAISFVTLSALRDRENASPSKVPRNPAILSSSANAAYPADFTATRFKPVLDTFDNVPVYDSRLHRFNFSSDLDNLSTVLPKFEGEIPSGSFAIAGYSLGHYDNNKDARPTLTTNILFVILVATE